jgi:hypothetical protein
MDPKIEPSRNDASSLTDEDLQGLKDSVKGKVVIKGHASQTEYDAAIDRWNHAYTKEAVRSDSKQLFSRFIDS